MKIITEAMVENHLTMSACMEAVRRAMLNVSLGTLNSPLRQFMPITDSDGKMAIMPGSIADPGCFGIKLVCKYPREQDSPYGTHVGMVLVFDKEKGLPLAMIEGSSLTAIRTAAASAVATDLLAKQDCKTLAIYGCGEQAHRHAHAMLAVRQPEKILIWGRDHDKAKSFSDKLGQQVELPVSAIKSAEETAKQADLICTTTSSAEPIISGEWLNPGTHVNLVGSAIPSTAEADQAVVTCSRFFVDSRKAALASAGELLNAINSGAITESHVQAEIGEVIINPELGRREKLEITVYKSLGVSAQDLATGHLIYDLAVKKGFGLEVEMMDYSAE